jgi:cytochrome c553
MKLRCALIASALASGTALAAQPLLKADAAKGQQIAAQVCAACHGADGNSIAPANPKLAGQIPDYLAKQLANFKPAAAGKPAERNNAIMAGFAATLSPEDMRNVAAYYASQRSSRRRRGTRTRSSSDRRSIARASPRRVSLHAARATARRAKACQRSFRRLPGSSPTTSTRSSRRSAPASARTIRTR